MTNSFVNWFELSNANVKVLFQFFVEFETKLQFAIWLKKQYKIKL
jgi:hypothetical protein